MKKIALLLFFASSVVAFAVDTYFVRPTGDVTSWSTQAIADPAQVLTITDISELTPYLGTSTKVFYLSKGTFAAKLLDETTLTSGYYLKLASGERVYGGFSGTETTINLTARALTDRDGNGNVEAWEFLNETIIDGQAGTTLGVQTKRLFGIESSGEVNGLSIMNFSFGSSTTGIATTAGGPIYVGSFLKTNNAGVAAAPLGYDATTSGSLTNCSIFNVSSYSPQTGNGGQGGAAIVSNMNSVINNCLFEQCMSNTFNSSMGGAVYVLGNGGIIRNTIFRNNKAYYTSSTGTLSRGGALYGEAYSASDMNLIVENCVFYNNSAYGAKALTGYGGAFRNDAVAGKRGAQFVNCTFSNNYNSTIATSGNVELINTGTLINCINYGGTNGFRANTTNVNYYLDKCVSTVANLDLAANAAFYPTSIFDATIDFGLTRPTTFNGAIFPGEIDYETKIVEIRKANFVPSKATSYLAANFGVGSLPSSYNATTGSSTVAITATLPMVDLKGNTRVMSQNTLGAYNFVAEGTVPTVAIRTTEGANVFSTNGSLVFQNCTNNLVTILTVDGKIIKHFTVGAENEKVSLSKGLYVVKVNDAFLKVFNR